MHHYRKTMQVYRSFPQPKRCPFCYRQEMAEVIAETAHARVIKNRVFYDVWDMQQVEDHLLVMPTRHVATLAELSPEERLAIMNMIAEYEAQGYNIYARAPHSSSRSVQHQHTHLIKTNNQVVRASFYMAKPYVLLTF